MSKSGVHKNPSGTNIHSYQLLLLVGGWALPLWKIWVRQLGWWNSQLIWKVIIHSCSSHHQAVFECHSNFSNHEGIPRILLGSSTRTHLLAKQRVQKTPSPRPCNPTGLVGFQGKTPTFCSRNLSDHKISMGKAIEPMTDILHVSSHTGC